MGKEVKGFIVGFALGCATIVFIVTFVGLSLACFQKEGASRPFLIASASVEVLMPDQLSQHRQHVATVFGLSCNQSQPQPSQRQP